MGYEHSDASRKKVEEGMSKSGSNVKGHKEVDSMKNNPADSEPNTKLASRSEK